MSTSSLTRLAPTKVELEIPLAPDEVAAAQSRAFARLSKNVRLPGFRKGKVPRKLFEQTYGTDAIESEALDDMAPLAYERALREHDLDPLDRPRIEVLPEEDGKPTRLRATVEVRPSFDLGEYKGISVQVPLTVVSDADVERSLAAFARERATLVPVEREARLGDAVTVDYEGRIDGVAFEGGSAQRQETELAEERFIPGFASGIAGMKPGETRTFEATFPQEYSKSEYAGKTAEFTVTLHEVKEVEVPALDDEFAKSAADVDSLDALKAEIRKRLEAISQARRRRAIGNAVMQRLLASLDVPVPQGLVDREIETMLERTPPEMRENDEAQLRERFAKDAQTQVKGTLVLEAIVKAEEIEATAPEIRAEIEALARSYGQPPERMRQALGSNLDSLKEGIMRGKAMDLLIDHAKVEAAAEGESTEV